MIALRRHRFSASWLLFVAAGAIFLVGLIARLPHPAYAASQLTPNSDEHVMSVYDNGDSQKTGFLTHDSTLKQALNDAGFHLAPDDITEPSLNTTLVASNYNVTIYRARPVLIIDGNNRTKVMTAYHTGSQIAAQAGIVLHDEDQTTLESSTNVVADGAPEVLVIKRATPLNLELYGTTGLVYTQSKTVAGLLADKGVVLGPKDHISPSLTTPITAGMTVEIWREGVQTATQQEPIHYSTRQINDANEPIGYRNVQTPGVNGTKSVTYQITVKNGKAVKRKMIQSVTLTKPVTEVVVVGTQIVLPAGSHTDWMADAGISSSDYGYAEFIIDHEGGWSPCKVQGGAIDCSYSGYAGYGLVQSTPGNKMAAAGSDWRTNPITQLKWATSYALSRYGSWQAAYEHWVANYNW